MERIPALLSFDAEPDEIEVEMRPQPWRGFERLLAEADAIRDRLAGDSGWPVAFNWFVRMDPQIAGSHGRADWVAHAYGEALRALRQRGDEIGLHPHGWRRDHSRRRWVADHGDPAWLEGCVRLAFETYEGWLGSPCRSVRFGDRFLSPSTVRVAAELGARYDLTVEPGAHATRSVHPGVAATGRVPSHWEAPRRPYRPSEADPLRPSPDSESNGPWMIPLTALDPGPLLSPARRIARRARHPRAPRYRPAVFDAPWDPTRFWRQVARLVDEGSVSHLSFAIRSDTFVAPARRSAVRAKLAALGASPLAGRVEFMTPARLIDRLGLAPATSAPAALAGRAVAAPSEAAAATSGASRSS